MRLYLSVVSPEFRIGVERRGSDSFTLVDNEPTVSLDPLPEQITEGEGLTVTVRLDRVADVTVTVLLDFCPSYDPFCQFPANIELSQSEATISAGDLFTTLTINTIDDDTYAMDERVRLYLRVVSPEFSVGVASRNYAEFRLLDNEPVVSLDPLPPQLANGITEGEALVVTAPP